MIDIKTETLRTLKEAAQIVPGAKRCQATIRRWNSRGIKGKHLEVIAIGKIIYTSDEALERFFSSLNGSGATASESTPKQRSRQSRSARQELEKLGV